MEKLRLSAVLVVLLTIALLIEMNSCSSDEPVFSEKSEMDALQSTDVSLFRTINDAYEIALQATSMLDDIGVDKARSGKSRMLDFRNPVKIIRNPLSRGVGNVNDTLMYVVNYADSMGFAVVSAVKGTPELIAVTMSGSYDPANPGDNPGFNMYMENASQVLSDGGFAFDTTLLDPNAHIKPGILEKTVKDTVWVKRIAPKARVNWGQRSPEGDLCPNRIAGCSNIAVVMAMLGLRYPSSIWITFSSSIKEKILDWNSLKNHRSWDGEQSVCNCSSELKYDISMLCRQLGEYAGTDYRSLTGSSTTLNGTSMCLLTLGFDVYGSDYEKGLISDKFTLNSEALVAGNRKQDNGETVGHMWLCDGIKHYKLRYRHMISEDCGKTWRALYTDYSQEYIYHMYNWGWYGNSNGYFLDMDFKADNGRNYNRKVKFFIVKH